MSAIREFESLIEERKEMDPEEQDQELDEEISEGIRLDGIAIRTITPKIKAKLGNLALIRFLSL